MDPLTHTLVGANLASTRLGTKTRLAAAACLIGANAPDIDVSAYFRGGDFAIGFRRGWTHGILALVVLPVVLWLLLLAWDRVGRSKKENGEGADRVPVRPGWLFAICVIAILTHPFLDWLNVYGMRWLMPFDETWTYGDSVFIMDPWLWLILASAWLIPRRATVTRITVWAVFTGLLALVVSGRAPQYLPLIGAIAAILLAALLWKPGGAARIHRFGSIGLVVAGVYIFGMLGLHGLTVERADEALSAKGVAGEVVLSGPLPVDSLRWDVLARSGDHYRFGTWSWWDRELTLDEARLPRPVDSELYRLASRDPSIEGYMRWVRFPWIDTEPVDGGMRVYILDARYTRERRDGFGGASVIVTQETERRE